MTAAVGGVALLVVLVALPACVRASSGVSPRVAAGAYLVSLLGWALLPALWLACFATALGSWLAGRGALGGACPFGSSVGPMELAGYGLAGAVLGLLAWEALRVAAATHRAELRGAALAQSSRWAMGGARAVWVVSSDQPAAYTVGLWRPKAVVTTALLAPLGPAERRAVCEHEAAHLRLGHPRLLLAGGSVAAAYGAFPPVRRAWDGLCRELEAAADDEAAHVVGAEAVLSALARAVLVAAGRPGRGAANFGGVEHLRYRMARLEDPRPARAGPTALVALAVVGVLAAMAWSMCAQAGAHASLLGVAACASAPAAVVLRPMWARRKAPGGGRAGASASLRGRLRGLRRAG